MRLFLKLSIVVTIAIMLTFSVFVGVAQEVQLANRAYQNGDYLGAIALYETAIFNGEVNGTIYYNLGNAYYANEQYGKAMQQYLRAQIYLPRNSQINNRIAMLRSERVDTVLTESRLPVLVHDLTADYLTLTEMAGIVFVIWLIFFMMLAMRIRRKGQSSFVVLSGLLMILAVSLLATRIYVDTQEPSAVVVAESVQAMSGPGDSYLRLFSLYETLDLRVLEERDGWIRFSLPDAHQGWIPSSSAVYIPNS